MVELKWLVLCVLLNIYICKGYKILLVFPLPSKSHGILGEHFAKHLLDAGHEVTYITPFINNNASENLHQIDVTDNAKVFNENTIDIKKVLSKETTFRDTDFLANLMIKLAELTMKNPNIQKFIHDTKQKFDVVIGEWMYMEFYGVFSTLFNCPMIWLSTLVPHWTVISLLDGPLNPAYSTDGLSLNTPPFSFAQRVEELCIQIDFTLRMNFNHYYKQDAMYQQHIVPILKERGKPVPSFQDIKYNVSLVFGNYHFALGYSNALPQNYIQIGGYHIDQDVKPLPENLKNIMDNAKNGVVFFSMGSNVKSKDLPAELKTGFLKVLGSLKQTVIWKLEVTLPDVPKNVHIVNWAPQQSILAHPNVVLFVTHGGLLSQIETIHFGVPAITIPVFADQFNNAAIAEMGGLGKTVELSYTMFNDLKLACDEILNNPEYYKKAKEISKTYHNVPLKPKEALQFWVKHVIETNGAPHLRSVGRLMPLYKRLYLDLLALILLVIIVLKLIVKRIGSINKEKNKEKHS